MIAGVGLAGSLSFPVKGSLDGLRVQDVAPRPGKTPRPAPGPTTNTTTEEDPR